MLSPYLYICNLNYSCYKPKFCIDPKTTTKKDNSIVFIYDKKRKLYKFYKIIKFTEEDEEGDVIAHPIATTVLPPPLGNYLGCLTSVQWHSVGVYHISGGSTGIRQNKVVTLDMKDIHGKAVIVDKYIVAVHHTFLRETM